MSTTQPATGRAAAGGADAGPVRRHLGLALVVIATAQLMVVLDATIVNVALPHIQQALGFSGTGLEWVVNAYALTFGGLLLLGGRAGDILGRRRVFIARIVCSRWRRCSAVSPPRRRGCSRPAPCRASAAPVIAPTALALITTTFPEGPPRNRAMGVYAAMSIGGAAVGLIAGGCSPPTCPGAGCCSSTCRSAIVALVAPRVLPVGRAGPAGSTCPARSPARSGWRRWSTA